ncbi:MAG TPA: hypothetical protein VFL83_21040 [Anaeromyxobacter sp.]|nr:hypothetical protein [Anaeromyxobacter sp.]
MPLDGTCMPRARAPASPPAVAGRRGPFWRGAAGAIALAGWTVAGVVLAALALAPAALLEEGPRRTARSRALGPGRPPRGAAAGEPAGAEPPVAAARAAGEAFPG